MKKILLVSGIAFLGFSASFAQERKAQHHSKRSAMATPQKSPEEIAEIKTQRLDKTVQLSAEQKKEVKAVYLKSAQERASSRGQSQEEINAILTPEQTSLLDAEKKDKLNKMKVREGTPRQSSIDISK